MDSKLMKFRFSDVSLSAHKGGCIENEALVSLTAGEDNPKTETIYWRFSFHDRLMKLTGWKSGDRINLEVDGTNAHLFRDNANGRIIGTPSKKGSRHYVKFVLPKNIASVINGAATEVETEVNRCVFKLPLQ